MATQTTNPATGERSPAHERWEPGRLVVNVTGKHVGLMRLDIDLPTLATAQDAKQHLQLEIPGETSPLTPVDVEGTDGRFAVSFFSSDIANAGHLPAEAIVTWGVPGSDKGDSFPVNVVSAGEVAHDEGEAAAEMSGDHQTAGYPQTVILMTALALVAGALALLAILGF